MIPTGERQPPLASDLETQWTALIEEVRFARDSPLEGGVSCELVSENAKFPVTRENTGNFIDSGLDGARIQQKRAPNQYLTGQFPGIDQGGAGSDVGAGGRRHDDGIRHSRDGFARRVADRCAFMDQGQIVEIAPAQRFFDAPKSPRLRAFLSQILH
jgi:hypothetical protein